MLAKFSFRIPKAPFCLTYQQHALSLSLQESASCIPESFLNKRDKL